MKVFCPHSSFMLCLLNFHISPYSAGHIKSRGQCWTLAVAPTHHKLKQKREAEDSSLAESVGLPTCCMSQFNCISECSLANTLETDF